MSELVLKKAGDWFPDCYTIEWANHPGKSWFVPLSDNGLAYMHSGRICDADIEGGSAEMIAIAEAIRSGIPVSFKRCGVDFMSDGTVLLFSPRNSQTAAMVIREEANKLATLIIERLRSTP